MTIFTICVAVWIGVGIAAGTIAVRYWREDFSEPGLLVLITLLWPLFVIVAIAASPAFIAVALGSYLNDRAKRRAAAREQKPAPIDQEFD